MIFLAWIGTGIIAVIAARYVYRLRKKGLFLDVFLGTMSAALCGFIALCIFYAVYLSSHREFLKENPTINHAWVVPGAALVMSLSGFEFPGNYSIAVSLCGALALLFARYRSAIKTLPAGKGFIKR